MIGRFDLTDWEWSIIEPLLPGGTSKKSRGRPRKDDRRVLNGIFFILRTGASWRDLPERYGPYTTAYNRFNRWAKPGVWDAVFGEWPSARPTACA
jgi:transposase